MLVDSRHKTASDLASGLMTKELTKTRHLCVMQSVVPNTKRPEAGYLSLALAIASVNVTPYFG